AVIGMNEMILRECRDATITKYANNVATASETLLSLINDILDFSKIESGKMELVEETYHLDELIENLVNMIRPRAEKKNLEFKVEVDKTIPNELFGDSVRIRQVVINFLTNAVKYTQVGRVTFIVSKEDKSTDEIMLHFSVKDTGIGIRDEDKKKLFRDFERFDSKKNKNIEGTGLGLAITSKLVNMMKGSIDVASTYGEGSTFTVMLPQKVMGTDTVGSFEQKMEAAPSKQEVYKVSFIAPEAKILVVDDNEMNLLVATSLLKATQIQVDTAMSGMSALKKMADKKYDLVFLDQMMPSLDGIQTLHLANEMEENKSKGVPMIALTANAISGAKEMFLKEGFTDYLSKPIDAKQMEAMLMTYLPIDKLHAPPKEDEVNEFDDIQQMIDDSFNQTDDQQDDINESFSNNEDSDKLPNLEYINVDLGMQYSAGMADMYKNILIMFCNLKDEKRIKIQEAFDNEDWQNYTTLVHALKSTALSIGGEKTSEAAKQLELAGKMIISGATSELEKQQGTEYIKEHHDEAMELYDKLVEDGRKLIDNL
ncbi:MAG: response regulator, partial [Selenomonadaceae bacterium]|nr:response regulator [Selenomonadaceae bacterium]